MLESRRSLTEMPTNVRLRAVWSLEMPCMQKEQSFVRHNEQINGAAP